MNDKPLGYKINEISRLFHNKVKEVANDKGISTTYFHIIGFLKRNVDNNVTQKDICQFVRMKPSTISLTLQSMEQEGYVARIKSDVDSRCTYVRITEKGLQLDERVKDSFHTVEMLMRDSLNENEYDILIKCLNTISRVLEE